MDPLDRLISSTYSENEMILKQSKWDYDPLGNLLYMNDINGNKLYTYDNVKKQQPIQIGNENIVHDTRGNVLRTSAYEIIWSSYSKPLSIKTNKSTTNYEYGPNRERVLKSTNNQTLLVHYIEDVYEKWTSVEASNLVQTTEKFYIKVLNKIIATKIVTKSGESKLFYIYNDPYGSVESITDEKGALLLKYTLDQTKASLDKFGISKTPQNQKLESPKAT